MYNWIFLMLAILAEITATTALKESYGFSKALPSCIVIIGYSLSFYFLALTLRTIPIGIAYAIWSGIGLTGITLIGWLMFDQKLDLAAIVGIVFILVGVFLIYLVSKTTAT